MPDGHKIPTPLKIDFTVYLGRQTGAQLVNVGPLETPNRIGNQGIKARDTSACKAFPDRLQVPVFRVIYVRTKLKIFKHVKAQSDWNGVDYAGLHTFE